MDGNNLIKLVLSEMTSNKIIETIDQLGINQPILDEEYEVNLKVVSGNPSSDGVTLVFQEVESFRDDLVLTKIDFYSEKKVSFPFGISPSDNYSTCCIKIGKEADYFHFKLKELNIWLLNDKKTMLAINFLNSDLSGIVSIVASLFNEDEVGIKYIKRLS